MPAATKPQPKPKKERAKFAAPLASGGVPLKITRERQREAVTSEGRKFAVPDTGIYIHFVDEGTGVQSYYSEDSEEIQFLRVRANEFGVFQEIPVPVPPSGPALRRVIKLTLERDLDGLVAMAAEEEETHQREEVLEDLYAAIESLK